LAIAFEMEETIVALATPSGVGAIGVIRLSGKQTFQVAERVFKGKKLRLQESHTIHFGTIRTEDGQILDEVLAFIFKGPNSYTGEDIIEFSCHGSPYIIDQILQLLIRNGARFAKPGEFTMRAYLNGKLDLSQAEAVGDLIAASSAGEHEFAMQQMRGGISKEISGLRQKLLDFASLIELELDFGEEDVAFADRKALSDLVDQIHGLVQKLIDSFSFGNAVKQGINTVIAGRPNAGKSTLLNALLNESRAIVSDIAGTTRDTIEEEMVIDSIRFRFIDTAGLRDAQDIIEAIGIEKTLEKVEQAAILLYVFDVVQTSPQQVQEDIEKWVDAGKHIMLIANKMDLNPYTTFEQYFQDDAIRERFKLSAKSWIPISAKNEMNISHLKSSLFKTALGERVNMDGTVITNARHYESLIKVRENMEAVSRGLAEGITGDFLAMDIRAAIHWLGEITGEISTDDLLGNIFGRFCIGK
jgi:tRNA modification GTPase